MSDESRIQRMTAPLELRLAPADAAATTFQGYLCRYGEEDLGGETVAPGAFSKSVSELASGGARLPLLWQHDSRQPIGSWKNLEDRPDGVWGTATVNTDILQGRNAVSLIKAGDISGLSIGFVVKKRKGDTILEGVLAECSLVSVPAMPKARIALKELAGLAELRDALQAGRPMSRRDAEFIARKAWSGLQDDGPAPEQIDALAARVEAATLEIKSLKGK